VVGVGPWINTIWSMLDLPKEITIKGRDGKENQRHPMWHYMALQEGTLGVDPQLSEAERRRDASRDPRRHRRAAIFRPRRRAHHRQALGPVLQAGLSFGGVQGGAMPAAVERPADQVRVDPYGPKSPEFVVTDNFADMWTSALAFCQKRFEGQHGLLPEGAVRRHRLLHARQLPRVRPLSRERVRDRRFQSRLQDDRRGRARREELLGNKRALLEPFRFSRYAKAPASR
jgi:hypothetical protein